MRVKDLKRLLETFDDGATVLMSKDGEGSAFKHVQTVEDVVVFETYEYSCEDWGCPGCDNIHEDLNQIEDIPEDVSDHKVVMIWPSW
jgi:hypothetical protein